MKKRLEEEAEEKARYRRKLDNLPDLPFPDGINNAAEYLTYLVQQGMKYRYGEPSSQVLQRVRQEMDAILSAHFEKYFLIWWKIAAICRENEVLYFCSSEANSSIICYALEITDIDPLEHNLLFEFFFNSKMGHAYGWWGENALISFCVSQNIIRYLQDSFGSECVFMYTNECNLAEIIITNKSVEKKEDLFCFIFSMPDENDSDWSDQLKEDRDEIYSKFHLKKLLGRLNINSFSDLLMVEAITYFTDDDIANEMISDLVKRKTIGYKPLFNGSEKILDETYGRILFEEQFILLVQLVTGWDVEKAYSFMLEMEQKRTDLADEFMACAGKAGVTQKDAGELYNTLIEVSDKLMGKAFILPWVQQLWRKSYLKAHSPKVSFNRPQK